MKDQLMADLSTKAYLRRMVSVATLSRGGRSDYPIIAGTANANLLTDSIDMLSVSQRFSNDSS